MTGTDPLVPVLVVLWAALALTVTAAVYGAAVATVWVWRATRRVCWAVTHHSERVAAVHARYGPPRRHGRRPTPGARYLEDDGTGR